jgi:hypothetical protein
MLIISVDYHPSFQQISFMDQETGECGDRELNHIEGQAERSRNRRLGISLSGNRVNQALSHLRSELRA